MRTLSQDRLDLIDALVAESDIVGITAGILEKDEHLTDPFGILSRALDQAKTDSQTPDEYEQNLLPLVYGNFKPDFDEAFATFERVARALLAEAGK